MELSSFSLVFLLNVSCAQASSPALSFCCCPAWKSVKLVFLTAAYLVSLLGIKTHENWAEERWPQNVICPGGTGWAICQCPELRSARKQEAMFILPSLAGWLTIALGSSTFCLKSSYKEHLSGSALNNSSLFLTVFFCVPLTTNCSISLKAVFREVVCASVVFLGFPVFS